MRAVRSHRWRTLALCLLGVGGATACGGAASVGPPARLDVLQRVYLRGAPSPARPQVALTFDGPTACTADLLARLRVPGEGLAPLRATFFFDRARTEALAVQDPEGLRRLVTRLAAEGHAAALGVPEVPAAWADSPAAFRRGLGEAAAAVEGLLGRFGLGEAYAPRLWRPGGGRLDWAALGQAAAADRPVVLWTHHADGAPPGPFTQGLLARLGDGDIVALPGGGAGCAVVEAIEGLARGLAAAGLEAVTVPAILGPLGARHAPARVARYLGPGLDAACAARLERPAAEAGAALAPRWGLVLAAHEGGARILPLGGADAAGPAEALAVGRDLWQAGRWRALPGCQQEVPTERILAPAGANRWWVVTDAGVGQRDPRALGAPHAALVLPALPDLVRLESRQRLPWPARGLVAGALERLRLEVPLLLEGRSAVAVIVGAPLAPAAAGDALALRGAVAGYLQVMEFSLAEYLFVARRFPAALVGLDRAARAGEGFLRAGPFLVTAAAVGGAPDPTRISLDGALALPTGGAEGLLAQVLAAGHALAPGDVVMAEPPPIAGPPEVRAQAAGASLRATLRRDLARSLSRGLASPAYLRPGSLLAVDGDLLGQLAVRVAVPPGVAAPTADALPLDQRREGGR